MLEAVPLDRRLKKKEYKRRLPGLQSSLHQLQRAYHEAGLSALLVLNGWDGAGLGKLVNKLTGRLEPRALRLHATRPARTHERSMPWMWRFWQHLPSWGEMGIFAPSWYRQVFDGRADAALEEDEWLRACRDVRFFEKALADDRYVVVKLFLHLAREEQAKRFEKLSADDHTAWRVSDAARHRHAHYDAHRVAIEETLQHTEAEWAPWSLIAATDRHALRVDAFRVVIAAMERGLVRHGMELPVYESPEELALAHEEDLDG